MENMKELSMETMEQVTGGVQRVVNTGIDGLNAAVRQSASKSSRQISSLPSGPIVDTVSDELMYDKDSAASIVGLKR